MPEPDNQADTADAAKLNRKIIAACVGIFGVLGLAWVLIPFIYCPPKTAAEFGDMFGGVNALFSGLAFVGLIWAILLQKQELQLQREELSDTRKELSGQREQLELQNSTFKQQAFDSVFFHMLTLHNQIVAELRTEVVSRYPSLMELLDTCSGRTRETAWSEGRDCFEQFLIQLRHFLEGVTGEGEGEAKVDLDSLLCSSGVSTFLSRYFSNFTSVLLLVEQDCNLARKGRYFDIVFAQISSYELALLFYFGLSIQGKKKFKPLIEKHSLFKDFPGDLLIHPSHKDWYEPRAFSSPK